MAKNPDIRAAQRQVDAARARVRLAGSLRAPSISYEFGKLGTPVSSEEQEWELRLSQGLPLFGQRGAAIRVAEADLAVAEAELESAMLRIRGDVARAYVRLQADERTLVIFRTLRSTTEDLEKLTGVRLASGQATYLDVLRARAERARLGNDLVEAERTLSEHRLALNAALARPASSPMEVVDSLAFVSITDSLPTILAQARNRPRLIAARAAVRRESEGLSLARSARRPAAEISGGLDRVPGADGPGWGGGVSLTLPFVPWANTGSRVEEAKALESSAQARLEAAERNLEFTLQNAYASVLGAQRQVESFQHLLLADAGDVVRAAMQNFQTGRIDGLELFEALRTLRSIQIEHVRALLNYELARIDLMVAE